MRTYISIPATRNLICFPCIYIHVYTHIYIHISVYLPLATDLFPLFFFLVQAPKRVEVTFASFICVGCMHVCDCVHACMHSCTYVYMCVYVCTRTSESNTCLIFVYVCIILCMCQVLKMIHSTCIICQKKKESDPHTPQQACPCRHVSRPIYTLTHKCIHTDRYTLAHTCIIHAYIHADTYTYTYMHTHSNTCKHLHIHAYIYTFMHIYIQA
jgi:hypothetical protein